MKTCFGILIAIYTLAMARADISPALRAKADAATDRGVAWLKAEQKDDGYFGYKVAPALTGLAVTAFSLSGEGNSDACRRAVDWIKGMSRPDGGIYEAPGLLKFGAGRSVYNTAICLTALHHSGRGDVREVMLGARKFLAAAQQVGDHAHTGGFSYEQTRKDPHADLSNTVKALEAMYLTREVEDLRAGERVEVDRGAAADYLTRLQHRGESNHAGWVSESPENEGGFAYQVPEKPADKLSRRKLRRLDAYGTLTYAGILSLIYADVDRSDPRVRSALEWAERHWTVAENPGKGDAGYYYFLNILAKCMNAYGSDVLTLEDGTRVRWREEVVGRILELQREDGSWENDNNRYWEGNPVLVTPYALTALRLAMGAEPPE